jgi:hypothetical protein
MVACHLPAYIRWELRDINHELHLPRERGGTSPLAHAMGVPQEPAVTVHGGKAPYGLV